MLKTLKKNWCEFKLGKPGQRFQSRYRRKRGRIRNVILGWSVMLMGAVLVVAGLFFLPAPGPGALILLAGAGLMAQESLAVARLLDRSELRLRYVTASSGNTWTKSSAGRKALLAVAGLVILAALGYGAWELAAFGMRLRA
jgi:hypothetical protein